MDRDSALRSVQQQIEWISERLDAKCWEVSKLQIEVYRLRAELRKRACYSEIDPQLGRCVPIGRADLVYTTPGGVGVYWREADKESCPGAGAGYAWGKTVYVLQKTSATPSIAYENDSRSSQWTKE